MARINKCMREDGRGREKLVRKKGTKIIVDCVHVERNEIR
jgi:hypothetical protein